MKNPRQAGQNVSGFIQSFENKTDSTRGPSRIPASARSVTPTRRPASPPPMTLCSPSRTSRSSPPSSSVESPPRISRAASRADQLRSAENMIEKMESRIKGNVHDLSFTVDPPAWTAEVARSAPGREARKHPYSELVLVNAGVDGDVTSLGTNYIQQKQKNKSSSFKIVTEEKHITSNRDAGSKQRLIKVPIAKDSHVAGKAETVRRAVSSSSAYGGEVSSRNDIATLQPQNVTQFNQSTSSSSFDASDQDTDLSQLDEPFRPVSDERAYDMPSPVSSQGDSGGHYGKHLTTSARSSSLNVDDHMLLSTDDGVRMMTLREKTRRYLASSKISESQVDSEESDGDQSPEARRPKTPLEVTDTSLEDAPCEIPGSRTELKVKPDGNSLDRPKGSSYDSSMFILGVHTDMALHSPSVPRLRHRERPSRKAATSRNLYGQRDELREPQWDRESEQLDQQTVQWDEEATKSGQIATGRPTQRRTELVLHKSKQSTSATTPQKKEPERGNSLSYHPPPEPFPSSTSPNHEADTESSRAKSSSQLVRSGSVSESGTETGQIGKPPPFRRISSDADIAKSRKGSKDSSDQALQPVSNPRALPDAGSKLRNAIKKSISISGVAAAFYRGGYLPIAGMSADNSTVNLNVFLREARREVEAGVPGRWLTAVLGSEAADLDSIFSSIAYAYLLHSTIKTEQQCFLPVINMRRDDLPLHMEAVWLFEVSGIDVKSLLFVDEISLSYYHRFGSLRLVLVDHSRLALHQEGLQEAIVEIVDHIHAGEELKMKNDIIYPWVLTREIEPVGSCCTLIAERFASEAPILLGAQGLRRILLAPILLDTGNLDKDAGQSTSRDETMVTLLLQGAGSYGRNGFYKLLRKKKFDTSVLNTKDLLRKDFNLWTFGPVKSEKHGYRGEKILAGMSSVGMTLGELLSREPDVVEHIVRFREWKRLRLLIIITGYYDRTSIFRRELFIAPEHPKLADDLAEYFNVGSDDGLNLKPLFVNGLPREMRAYSQGHATASRKKIQPMLFEFFCT